MSLAERPGGPGRGCQSVSVVPMIQCPPHGMTNSTDFSVRRISPASPEIAAPGHHEVHALGGPYPQPGPERTAAGGEHLGDVVAPHAGGGDRPCGRRRRTLARLDVLDPDAGDLAGRAQERGGPGRGDHGRAEAGRGAGQGGHQPGVVDLRVVVADRAADGVRRAATGRSAGRPPALRWRCSGMPRSPPTSPANAS